VRDAAASPPPKIDFKEELRPYGEWLVITPYGKLWHPYPRVAGEGFVPYLTNGRWLRGDRGWSFQSDFEWGSLVFNYGRWLWLKDYEWVWSLDEKWARPCELALRLGQRRVGADRPGARGAATPEERWVFVKARHFAQPSIEKFKLNPEESVRAMNLTEPLTSSSWSGPPLGFIASEDGLVALPDAGYRVPDISAPTAEPLVQPPPSAATSNVKVETPSSPPPKKVKKKGKKK